MHGPGVNYSDRIRQAVLYEFASKSINDGAPPQDMWRDWSEEVRAIKPELGALPCKGLAAPSFEHKL